MKNKKSMSAFGVIITAAISLILLFVFIGPIIKGIFVDKQLKFAGGQTEQITIDCDGDTYLGFSDLCPCNKDKHEKEDLEDNLEAGPCGVPSEGTGSICPKLCKK